MLVPLRLHYASITLPPYLLVEGDDEWTATEKNRSSPVSTSWHGFTTPVLLGARGLLRGLVVRGAARGAFVALASYTLLCEDEGQPVVAETNLLLPSEVEGNDEWTERKKPLVTR
jgi:hypothetical protein